MHRILAIPFVFAALALAVPALACPKGDYAKKSEAKEIVFTAAATADEALEGSCAAKKGRVAGSHTCPFLAAKAAEGGCGGCGGGCGDAVFAATEPTCGAGLAEAEAAALTPDEARAAALRFVRSIAALFALDGVLVASAEPGLYATR